jgi:hypothetical protein
MHNKQTSLIAEVFGPTFFQKGRLTYFGLCGKSYSMKISWKKKLFIICYIAVLALVLLSSEFLQIKQQPAAHGVVFLFLFFAVVIFYPLVIKQARPSLSRCYYRFNRRPPPSL